MWLIAAVWALAAGVLAPISRPPSWDEAIYLSQVTPGIPALRFVASRSRGITLLAFPSAHVSDSIAVTRVCMVLLLAVLLALAFSQWRGVLGRATPIAELAFAGSWIGIFYGAEVMPNLPAALLAVGAAGAWARHVRGERARADPLVLAAAFMAAMALIRPLDAAIVLVALGIGSAFLRTGRWRSWTWLAAGFALGAAPWLIEISLRFGGPLEGLRDAMQAGHVTGGLSAHLRQYLSLSDGSTLGPVARASVPLGGAVWAICIVGFAVVGLIAAGSGDEAAPIRIAALAALSLAVVYLGFVSGLAPRLLLPAYAFLCVPAAWGARHLWRTRPLPARAAIVVLAVAIGAWNLSRAVSVGDDVTRARQDLARVGEVVDARVDQPCAVLASQGFPEIGYASGCSALPLDDPGDASSRYRSLTGRGYATVIVTSVPVDGLRLAARSGRWLVYMAP